MLNHIALDLDGVIFDYEKTFRWEAFKLGFNILIKHPEIYNMPDRYEITEYQLSLINSKIDFSDMDVFEEVPRLKRHIAEINCFITSSPREILHLRKINLKRIFGKDIPLHYAEPGEKRITIKELGIKYFIDDYNVVIHHIDLNHPECKAYWLDRGYMDKSLPEPKNKVSSLAEFLGKISI